MSKHNVSMGISQLALIAGHMAMTLMQDNDFTTDRDRHAEIIGETLMDQTGAEMVRGKPAHETAMAGLFIELMETAVADVLDAQGAEMITLQDGPSGISVGVYINGFGILPYVRTEEGAQRVSYEGLLNIGAEREDLQRIAGLAPQLWADDRLSMAVGPAMGVLADLLSASQPVATPTEDVPSAEMKRVNDIRSFSYLNRVPAEDVDAAVRSGLPFHTFATHWNRRAGADVGYGAPLAERRATTYGHSVAFADRSDRATWPGSPFRSSTPSNRTIANAAHLAGERLQVDGYAIERCLIEIRDAVFPDKSMVYGALGQYLPGAAALLARALGVTNADVSYRIRNPLESLFERQGVKFLEGPQIAQLVCAQINAEYGRSGAASTDNHVAIAKEIAGELITLDAASRITGFSVNGIRAMAATMTTGVERDDDGTAVRIRIRSLIRFIQREREHLAQTTAEMAEQLGTAQDEADKAYQRGREAFLEPFKRAAETLRNSTVKTSTPSTPKRKG